MNKQEYEDYQNRLENFKLQNTSAKYEENGDTLDPHFSWYSCDCCNRPQGGDRFDMVGLDENNELTEFRACADCVYYLEYGRLDDMTMMDIERS